MRRIAPLFLVLAGFTSSFAQRESPTMGELSEELQSQTIFLNPEFLVFSPKAKIRLYPEKAPGAGRVV